MRCDEWFHNLNAFSKLFSSSGSYGGGMNLVFLFLSIVDKDLCFSFQMSDCPLEFTCFILECDQILVLLSFYLSNHVCKEDAKILYKNISEFQSNNKIYEKILYWTCDEVPKQEKQSAENMVSKTVF
jgi:hypothetical protein